MCASVRLNAKKGTRFAKPGLGIVDLEKHVTGRIAYRFAGETQVGHIQRNLTRRA